MTNNTNYKQISNAFEVKELESDEKFLHIEGWASTFGNLDRDNDIVSKGAFTNTLTKRKPKLLYQHRMDQPIGVIDQAYETNEGLYIKGRLPKDNSMVKDIMPLLKMGALSDFSVGFNVVEADTSPDGVRTIKEIDLWEVSIVTIPANADANITGVKKKDEIEEKMIDVQKAESITTKREFEKALRETGMFTRKASEILTKRFTEDDKQGEPVDLSKQGEPVSEEKQGDPASDDSFIKAIEEFKKSLKKED